MCETKNAPDEDESPNDIEEGHNGDAQESNDVEISSMPKVNGYKAGLAILTEAAINHEMQLPSEVRVYNTRVGMDGNYVKTSLVSDGYPVYSKLGDLGWMTVKGGAWVCGKINTVLRTPLKVKNTKNNPSAYPHWEEKKKTPDSTFEKKTRIDVYEFPEFNAIPYWARAGPWSPVAIISLFLCGILIAALFQEGYDQYPIGTSGKDLEGNTTAGGIWRLLLGTYMLCLTIYRFFTTDKEMFRKVLMTSYTMSSWNILTLRLILSGLGTWIKPYERVAEYLRSPALTGASTVVGIWWVVIFPIALIFILKTKDQRIEFLKWQTDWFPVNVHFLNIIIAGMDHMGVGGGRRHLTSADLFISTLLGCLYLIFYLSFHDPRGWHLYIVLTPRFHGCILVYGFIFALCYGFWAGWREVY